MSACDPPANSAAATPAYTRPSESDTMVSRSDCSVGRWIHRMWASPKSTLEAAVQAR